MAERAPHADGRGVPQELVRVVRSNHCPGVELIEVLHSPRTWGHLNGVFAFGRMRDWHGALAYRRRNLSLNSGDTFLFDPGELFHAPPHEGRAGEFRVVEILPAAFEALCHAEGHCAPLHFAQVIPRGTPDLDAALDALRAALVRDAEPLEQQSRLAALAHAAVTGVLERGARSFNSSVPLGPCERLREILHSSEGTRVNLCDFARGAGVSQFQLLRSFKRRYGSPPHAYGLQVRVERGRQLLRSGFTVAQTAAATDFTDQSHFTRHFRRIWGVTPGQYAAGSLQRTPAREPAPR